MKFLILAYAADEVSDSWAGEDFGRHCDAREAFDDNLYGDGELIDSGYLVGGVRAPDPVAGFWLVDVDGPDRAASIAAGIEALPGPGESRVGWRVQIRQVLHPRGGLLEAL